jgi:hypothetical protein
MTQHPAVSVGELLELAAGDIGTPVPSDQLHVKLHGGIVKGQNQPPWKPVSDLEIFIQVQNADTYHGPVGCLVHPAIDLDQQRDIDPV